MAEFALTINPSLEGCFDHAAFQPKPIRLRDVIGDMHGLDRRLKNVEGDEG